MKWNDRFPVIFALLLFFWPLGILFVWLSKRFEKADKQRLTALAVLWGFMLPVIFDGNGSGQKPKETQAEATDAHGFREVSRKHLSDAQLEKDKTTPYYRSQEGIPKETRAAIFAETRDKRLKAAEDSLNAGNALGAIKLLARYSDVLPDKESKDLYERIRKAVHEEASAELKKADDNGKGNDPSLVPLLEELDFLVSPSMWYRERLDALKRRTEQAKRLVTSGNNREQGQTFRLGNFSYTVGSAYYKNDIGPRGGETFASKNALFLVVNYTIQNETQETQTVASDDFKLRDAKGREFRPSAKALTALILGGANKDFILSELQPGVEHQTKTAFEIPHDSTIGGLVLIVPEKGVFGSGKVEVVLNDIQER